MGKKATKGTNSDFNDKILAALLDDPTRSSKQMAEELNITRQKLWREKRRLEEERQIWGYTAVVDEAMGEWVDCIILFHLKPYGGERAAQFAEQAKADKSAEFPVRIREVFFTDGEYDAMFAFTAPDMMVARRFYEYLRLTYDDVILGKPIMIQVGFAAVREGKLNPNIDTLIDMAP